MNDNFRWHYVKDNDYPKISGKCRDALVIVKQLLHPHPDTNDLVETYSAGYYGGVFHEGTSDEYHRFVSTLYGEHIAHGVVAWCYVKDIVEQLDNMGENK